MQKRQTETKHNLTKSSLRHCTSNLPVLCTQIRNESDRTVAWHNGEVHNTVLFSAPSFAQNKRLREYLPVVRRTFYISVSPSRILQNFHCFLRRLFGVFQKAFIRIFCCKFQWRFLFLRLSVFGVVGIKVNAESKQSYLRRQDLIKGRFLSLLPFRFRLCFMNPFPCPSVPWVYTRILIFV